MGDECEYLYRPPYVHVGFDALDLQVEVSLTAKRMASYSCEYAEAEVAARSGNVSGREGSGPVLRFVGAPHVVRCSC